MKPELDYEEEVTVDRVPFTESAQVSRALGIIGLSLFLAGLFILRTDFEIVAYGTVSRDTEYTVYAPDDGRVETILLREGDPVSLGETVLTLDQNDLELRLLAKRRELAGMEFQIAANDLALRELEMKPASVEMLVARDKSRLLSEISSIQKDLTGRLEALERSRDIKTIELLSGRIGQLRVELEGLESQVRADWMDAGLHELDREKLLLEQARLQRDSELASREIEIMERDQALRLIRSPVRGQITRLPIRHTGLIVRKGEALFTVADLSSPYLVEVLVPERNVDLIRPGAPVRMESEVFDSTFDGYIHGVVRRVSPDTMSQPGEAGPSLFKVEVEVEKTPLPLVLGSRLKTSIILGQRPIWRVFFDPRGGVDTDRGRVVERPVL